jgi:hypothetical protein
MLVFILFLSSLYTISVLSSSFYIYDWPDLVDRYAKFTDRSHLSHGVEFPAWLNHHGAGRLVDPLNLEHKTSQFGLFKIMYERALMDKRRTMNPEHATTFLIPFDIGMHITFLETNGRMRRSGCPLSDTAIDYLQKSKYFNKNFGHDHLLVFSINYNMNYFMSAPKCQKFMQTCWNCTKLAIDEYLFTAKHRHFEAKNRGINWHAVPFPSDYHFSVLARKMMGRSRYVPPSVDGRRALQVTTPDDNRKRNSFRDGGGKGGKHHGKHHGRKSPPTEDATIPNFHDISEDMENWSPPWMRYQSDRKILVSFTGNPRRFNEWATLMRESLIAQCANHTEHCVHGAYKHDSKRSNNDLARNSVFCLQPPGDMPSRKSVFDTILSGCIPVLFHPLTAKYMYEWHFGQDLWTRTAISFDSNSDNRNLMENKVDFIQKLIDLYKNNREDVLHRRKLIAKHAFQLQYSLVDEDMVTTIISSAEGNKVIKNKNKVVPIFPIKTETGLVMKDAYDVSMTKVLEIHAGQRTHERTDEFVACAVIPSKPVDLQTADWCNSTQSVQDPYSPSAYHSYLFNDKGRLGDIRVMKDSNDVKGSLIN